MPPNTSGSYRKESIPDVIPDREKKDRINCVVVGDSSVGKTSLIVSYTSNGYPEKYVPTVHDYYTGKIFETKFFFHNKIFIIFFNCYPFFLFFFF